MAGADEGRVAGTQAVGRAFALLRLIALRGRDGAALADLARAAGLARPTAHRLLKALIAERMVEPDPAGRGFRLGPLAFELGVAAPQRGALVRACRPALQRLAAGSEDTVYLILRSGFEAVCLDRIEASHAIRTATMEVGAWRPLGVGAAGTALLAGLGDEDVARCLASHGAEFARYGGLSAEAVRAAVQQARRDGIAFSIEKLTAGVSAVGIAVPAAAGAPLLGISIASTTERITGDRLPLLRRLLADEAARLSGMSI